MSDEGIREFWQFWQESRPGIERAIQDKALLSWVDAIGARVKAVHEGLDWEMGAGLRAQHYLALSAKGDPAVRVVAERWRAAGPGDDEVFEFHASRPGGGLRGDLELVFNDVPFRLGDFRFAPDLEEGRERIHVGVWHPSFERSPEQLWTTVTYIALDTMLGEDEVERWLGAVEVSPSCPEGAVEPGELLARVEQLRGAATGERFAILRGQLGDGSPIFVTANIALKRVDHLLMDTHIEVDLLLRDPTPEGLTTQEEADQLNAAEDELLEALGHDAVYIARETRQGHRVLHFHVASTGSAPARMQAWARAHPWESEVRGRFDPAWEVLRRW